MSRYAAFVGRRFDTITLMTDYGTVDEFVGVVKAVVRDLAPHVGFVDLTHHIPAFDVRAGALTLARSVQYLPSGVVIAVVDPGVGTDRRAIAIEVAGGEGILLGPDNGLLAPAVAMTGGAERAVVLDNPEFHLAAAGSTFAGRDIFAPVAAHLCNGVELTELGTEIDSGLLLPSVVPLPRVEQGVLVCEVMWIDHYGNAQLNVGPADLDEEWGPGWGDRIRVQVGDHIRSMPVVGAFADLSSSAPGLVVDSYGMLAIAINRYSAAGEMTLGVTDQVILQPTADVEAPSTPVQLRIER